ARNSTAVTCWPDTSRNEAFNDSRFKGGGGHVTWQASQKNKFAVAYDYQNQCNCPRSLTASIAPESNVRNHAMLEPKDMWFLEWTAPVTNRLLVEVRGFRHREHAYRPRTNLYFTNDPGGKKLNGVVEPSTGLTYLGVVGYYPDTWLYSSNSVGHC